MHTSSTPTFQGRKNLISPLCAIYQAFYIKDQTYEIKYAAQEYIQGPSSIQKIFQRRGDSLPPP